MLAILGEPRDEAPLHQTKLAAFLALSDRRVVTRDAIYDIADYVAEPSAWRRERVVWHLWCQTWLLPDCLEWLRPRLRLPCFPSPT